MLKEEVEEHNRGLFDLWRDVFELLNFSPEIDQGSLMIFR
jgi:hypothetical protein